MSSTASFPYVQHGLCFSPGQIRNICLLRRFYLQLHGKLEQQQKEVKSQQRAAPWTSVANSRQAEQELSQQVQSLELQIQEVRMLYKRVLLDGV